MTGLGSFSGPSLRGVAWGGDGPVGLAALSPSCLLPPSCLLRLLPRQRGSGGDTGKAVEGLGRGTGAVCFPGPDRGWGKPASISLLRRLMGAQTLIYCESLTRWKPFLGLSFHFCKMDTSTLSSSSNFLMVLHKASSSSHGQRMVSLLQVLFVTIFYSYIMTPTGSRA